MASGAMFKHVLKHALPAAFLFLGRGSGFSAAEPLPGDKPGAQLIRTPPVSPKPRINGARIFGARPGAPFLFTIAASGQKPLRYSATNLPAGLHLDAATGRLTGCTAAPGAYDARVTVANALGRADATLRIVSAHAAIRSKIAI
jgi:alpha-galactosidase